MSCNKCRRNVPGFRQWQEEPAPARVPLWTSGSLSQGHPRTGVILMALAAGIAFAAGMYTAQYDASRTPWTCVRLLGHQAVCHHVQCQHAQTRTEATPAVLAQLLVMITFHFDAAHLAWLAQARVWKSPNATELLVARVRLRLFLVCICLTLGTVTLLFLVCSTFSVRGHRSSKFNTCMHSLGLWIDGASAAVVCCLQHASAPDLSLMCRPCFG